MRSALVRSCYGASRFASARNLEVPTSVASRELVNGKPFVSSQVTNYRSFCTDADQINKDFFHVCGKGDVELARRMLLGGWRVNDRDKTKATALMWAATEGHLPMVKFLIDEDADLNAKNNIGSTALWYAIWKGHKEVAVYLKDAGADINTTDIDGNSLLHLAADEGKIEYVKLLLEWGVDMHIINWDGFLAKDLAQDKQVRELLNKDIDFTYY